MVAVRGTMDTWDMTNVMTKRSSNGAGVQSDATGATAEGRPRLRREARSAFDSPISGLAAPAPAQAVPTAGPGRRP